VLEGVRFPSKSRTAGTGQPGCQRRCGSNRRIALARSDELSPHGVVNVLSISKVQARQRAATTTNPQAVQWTLLTR